MSDALIPCVACGEPATVELTLTFTKGRPVRLALCAECEADSRTPVKTSTPERAA